MPDDTFLPRVGAFMQTYIGHLDRREFKNWIKLFADDGYYSVLRNIEMLDGDNVLLVGENLKRLSGRLESGETRDLRRMVHAIGWIVGDAAQHKATASFMLWLDGKPSTAGRYELEFSPGSDPLAIAKCTVVLDTIDIIDTIYLPI